MHEWLYGAEGYYHTFRPIGKEGDFYTAVSTSPFFGASIADFLCKKIQNGDIPRDAALVEIGAHQGYLLADMIQWIYTCDSSLLESVRFIIVERQESVRQTQREYFAEKFGDAVRLEQAESLDELSLPYAFFISNEIFDAFACDLYINGKVADIVNGAVLWKDVNEKQLQLAGKYGMDKGEIAVGYEEFAERVVSAAEHFDFVSFDYGDKYARNDFSIRIYTEHKVYPFFDEEVKLSELFGRSDITYDVNFAYVIDVFEDKGAELVAMETQARALVRFGIIDLLEQYAAQSTQAQYLHEADKVKTLLAPNVMGERFKMIHLKK
jgi:SAM-dependent MidA family methyltransferase